MHVSLGYLEQCAYTTGFPVATLEKVTQLGRVAGSIAQHPRLKEALALKGGTAFNLCFGAAPSRLSVDLDYNYIANADRQIMLEDKAAIESTLIALIERLGFRVQQSADEFAGRKIYAIYTSVLGNENRVEVDLNYLWRVPLNGVQTMKLWQPGALDRPTVQVVSLHELCIGKFLAFLDRSAVRDVYDLSVIPGVAQEVLDVVLFRKLFIALAATLPRPLPTYLKSHVYDRLTERAMREQLTPMLGSGTWHDRGSLIDTAWQTIAPFVRLESHEAQYIQEIDQGVANTALLFPEDDALAERIQSHPAIQWKIFNVRKKLGLIREIRG